VVDDASSDGTHRILAALAARHPRVAAVRRTANSGGCGTPRNEGLRRATAPWVMFLDSDDMLEPGAVDALLAAAVRHDAPVVAGRCVRRELPGSHDEPWQPELFLREAVVNSPAELPGLVHDTLCVNKLYSRAFLAEHGIAFPEGRFRYEDFVFTARVLAAAPRIALVPRTVYVWHVRRAASRPSISLDRADTANWRGRLRAHRSAVAILEESGQPALARAARVKFLDHDLRMYARELPGRSEDYRAGWWRLTRAHLASFDASDLSAARPPARWIARVVSSAGRPRDLDRLAELAGRPARLLPPYARVAGRPVWDEDLPGAVLDGIGTAPLHRLPITVEGEPVPGRRLPLRITVHEMYGRLAAAGPVRVEVVLRSRSDGRPGPAGSAALHRQGSGPVWTAELLLDLEAPAARGGPAPAVWDVRARIRCADGSSLCTAVRAVGSGLRRAAVPSLRHGVLLVQPYATATRSLAVRIAPGPRAAATVAARRLRRILREGVVGRSLTSRPLATARARFTAPGRRRDPPTGS
jgi:hypothetical protein